jgi:oxygen-independent coproporphyrinogen-3 oxidase
LSSELLQQVATPQALDTLAEMEKEGILYLIDGGLKVTTTGAPFIRNICRVFDRRVDCKTGEQLFSNAV